MKLYFYNAILGILALIVLTIPFIGKVHDGRHKWFKGFTIRGWIVFTAFIASIFVNYLKDVQVEKDDLAKSIAVKIEKRQTDSISRRRNDESNAKIVNTFISALAKYNLKYDSTQKVVLKFVRDSSKKEIKNSYGNHPELAVRNIELSRKTNDSLVFNIIFYTKQAAANHTTIRVYTTLAEEGKPFYFIQDKQINFINDVLIPLDKDLRLPRNIFGNNAGTINGTFYFILIGKFYDSDNKKFPFKVIESYDMSNKSFGSIIEPTNTQLINFLHQRGIDY